MSPASTGPMLGGFQADLIRLLGDLRVEVNQAVDRAQVGAPIPDDDPLARAIADVLATRRGHNLS